MRLDRHSLGPVCGVLMLSAVIGSSSLEPPGAAHSVIENASATAPARLLAVFVAEGGAELTTFDQ
jgi:hypothetical protein